MPVSQLQAQAAQMNAIANQTNIQNTGQFQGNGQNQQGYQYNTPTNQAQTNAMGQNTPGAQYPSQTQGLQNVANTHNGQMQNPFLDEFNPYQMGNTQPSGLLPGFISAPTTSIHPALVAGSGSTFAGGYLAAGAAASAGAVAGTSAHHLTPSSTGSATHYSQNSLVPPSVTPPTQSGHMQLTSGGKVILHPPEYSQ